MNDTKITFNRNYKQIVFQNEFENGPFKSGKRSLADFVTNDKLTVHILSKIPLKAQKHAVWMLESLNYHAKQDLKVIWNNKDVFEPSTKDWLDISTLFKQFKPVLKIGQKQFKKQFENPSTNMETIENRQALLADILSRGEGFVEFVRKSLKKLYIPGTETFEGIVRCKVLFDTVRDFMELYFPNIPFPNENKELFEILSNTVRFDRLQEHSLDWFKPTPETEGMRERWTQIANHFQMQLHDYKRRVTPQIRIDDKQQCLVVPRTFKLNNLQNYSVKKYTKSEVFFTTVELNELFVQQEALEEQFAEFIAETMTTWPKLNYQSTFDLIATIDVSTAFAERCSKGTWCRPSVGTTIKLSQSSNPLVENCLPNDFENSSQTVLITGFNSSGKSTFLRTVGWCVYLNQIGCFVPASCATLPIFNKVASRANAEDSLGNATSTFTAQMTDLSYIIRNESLVSTLVLLDEVGSNTNAKEGKAIFTSVLNYLNACGATTLATTHFDVQTRGQCCSMTSAHRLVPYDTALASDGWKFCIDRGFI